MRVCLKFKKGPYVVKIDCRVSSMHAVLLSYCSIGHRNALLETYMLSMDAAATISFWILQLQTLVRLIPQQL